MTLIKIQGMPEHEGWVGVLGPMVGSTAAQGESFSTKIAPPESQMNDEDFVEVYLPAGCIRVIKS